MPLNRLKKRLEVVDLNVNKTGRCDEWNSFKSITSWGKNSHSCERAVGDSYEWEFCETAGRL
jgi:hypothetical protein